MYFWKIEELKQDIREKNVSEFTIFIYFMIFFIGSYAVYELSYIWPPEEVNNWDIIGSIASIVLGVSATFTMFFLNGGKSGNQFLTKYFSIGFVASIRYFVITIPLLLIPFMFSLAEIDENSDISTTGIETIVLFVWELGLYAYICKHISEVKNS